MFNIESKIIGDFFLLEIFKRKLWILMFKIIKKISNYKPSLVTKSWNFVKIVIDKNKHDQNCKFQDTQIFFQV